MVRKPTKDVLMLSLLKRRHNVISDDFHENVPAPDQPLISIVPSPPVPASQVSESTHISPAQDDQTKGRKRNRPQFYGFTDADISPTSSLASSSSAKPKKRKNKKDKKAPKPENSVVALIQNAEQSRIPSPPRPDLQLGQVSPSDRGIRYFEYEQEREMSVWDAENQKYNENIQTLKTETNYNSVIHLCICSVIPIFNLIYSICCSIPMLI